MHADLYPFELHSPKLGIFGLRLPRVVGSYVSGLTRVCNPYTTTLKRTSYGTVTSQIETDDRDERHFLETISVRYSISLTDLLQHDNNSKDKTRQDRRKSWLLSQVVSREKQVEIFETDTSKNVILEEFDDDIMLLFQDFLLACQRYPQFRDARMQETGLEHFHH